MFILNIVVVSFTISTNLKIIISLPHSTFRHCNTERVPKKQNLHFICSRFSVGKLPVWAKKQLVGGPGQGKPSDNTDLPKGRWAARIGGQVTVKSHYDSDSVIPFPAGHPNKENKNNSNVNNETSEHDADIDEYRY